MDPLRALTAAHGYFTRREALNACYSERQIARYVRSGVWVRFRHGCYAFPDEWSALDDLGRHKVRCNAVQRVMGDAVALSHVSGAIPHGIDVWGIDLDRVHVTRLDGGPGRIDGDVVHHEGFVADGEVQLVDGRQVLTPERCVLEASSRVNNEIALCVLESGLRSGLFDADTLCRQFEVMQRWPYMQHLQIPVRMADGRSGSVGESRGIWAFFTLGIPAPERQFVVRGPSGDVIGVTDWYWPAHHLIGEFDGRVKYGRLLRPGQDPGQVVFDEKKREDNLREITQAKVFRLVWSDYDRPLEIRSRFSRLIGRSA